MIRRVKGELVVECDECGETLYGGTLDFGDFKDDFTAQGWRVRKEGGEWVHFCLECAPPDR